MTPFALLSRSWVIGVDISVNIIEFEEEADIRLGMAGNCLGMAPGPDVFGTEDCPGTVFSGFGCS